MHILLIHQFFLEKDGGGGSRFNQMARMWAEAGHQITVLSGMVHYSGRKDPKYKGKFIVKEEFASGITVYRCYVSSLYNVNYFFRFYAYLTFVFSSTICGIKYRGKNIDLVLATSPPLFVGITALLISRIQKKPFVFEVRDLWPESAIDTGVLKNAPMIGFSFFFEKFVYNQATMVNALTPAFKKSLIEKKGVAASRVTMIPNAADFDIVEQIEPGFDPIAFKKELAVGDAFVVTYVGAHGVANHLIQMIETAELLKLENVVMVLVGDGMQKEMLKKEAAQRGLNNIRFIDSIPKQQVFKYILVSDAGASVLKKCDTFKTVYSNKTFDYMSCKKPILLAIDGVSRELVETAQCGLFVEPENPADFAEKILLYKNRPAMALKHGQNGYDYAKKYFDRAILAKQYLEELKKVAVR